jgi:hypothetical protein
MEFDLQLSSMLIKSIISLDLMKIFTDKYPGGANSALLSSELRSPPEIKTSGWMAWSESTGNWIADQAERDWPGGMS